MSSGPGVRAKRSKSGAVPPVLTSISGSRSCARQRDHRRDWANGMPEPIPRAAIPSPAFRSQADLGEFNRLRAVGSLLVQRLTMLRHTRGQLLSRGRCLPCQGDRIPALQGRATVRQSQTLVA